MKKLILLFTLALFTAVGTAQKKKQDFSKEIDQQLWKSFVQAYNSRDTDLYLSIHTDDIVRITQSGIRQGSVFQEGIKKSFARKNQPKRAIEFKHEHRIHEENIAYEVGYFKVTYYRDGKEEEHFGRFSVVLKKVDGQWKIAQDWDVDKINGVPIIKKDYNKLESAIIRG